MKAFIIKNKEGKYFAGFNNLNVFVTEKDITNAVMYRADRYEKYELENAPEFKDCEVVEITIAEGDLEQDIKLDNAFWKQECDSLQKTLAEKDKEIEELKFEKRNLFGLIEKVSSKGQQEIRKQVCDKIREFIDNNDHSEENEAKQSSESVIYTKQLYKFLDQTEQAKESVK